MKHLILSRLFNQNKSVMQLNNPQLNAIKKFKQKIKNGDYLFEKVPCLCGEKEGVIIATRDRYGLSVPTHLCNRCGIMWTSPRLNESSLKKFYENDYRPIYVGSPQAPDSFFREQTKHGEKIYNFICKHIESESHSQLKVFDIGCGAGGTLLPFKNNGWLTFGCDLGSDYLKRGREEGLILENGDATSLSRYGPANLVILSHVLEHFPHPLESINQISELLNEDGYLYIEVPGIFNIHRTYGDILLFLQNAHLYHFTLFTLSSLMSRAGFKIIMGDQIICALFQKTKENIENENQKNEYYRILFYLYFIEIFRRMNILKYTSIFNKALIPVKRTRNMLRKLINMIW